MKYLLELPYPPSTNSIWKKAGSRIYLSDDAIWFRSRVAHQIAQNGLQTLSGSVCVSIEAYPPDRRQRDADNVLKATLDALAHGKLLANDSQVKRLAVEMHESVDQAGRLLVSIEDRPIAKADPSACPRCSSKATLQGADKSGALYVCDSCSMNFSS